MNKITINNIQLLRKTLASAIPDDLLEIIKQISQLRKKQISVRTAQQYQDVLLFGLAHPISKKIETLIVKELSRIKSWLKTHVKMNEEYFDNSGLCNSDVFSYYSYETLIWLKQIGAEITLEHFDEQNTSLAEFLFQTLPSSEKDNFNNLQNNIEAIELLGIKEKDLLDLILNQMKRLPEHPGLRDFFFDRMKLALRLKVKGIIPDKSENRLNIKSIFYHQNWLRKMDSEAWLQNSNFSESYLTEAEQNQIIFHARISLILLQRETDPVRYTEIKSVRLFEMGRGIQIALYTMRTERQLYPELYIGYTLFKNGFPAAYGGAWTLGGFGLFGVNIFEWCRGGESSLMVLELLRLYKHFLGVEIFEIEAYQYGKDNPEGITSGAFWFYYRMGFRPVDVKIKKLAEREYQKIARNKNYRSSEKTLLKFTDCNLRLQTSSKNWPDGNKVKSGIYQYILKNFRGDRFQAEELSLNRLKHSLEYHFNEIDTTVQIEMALLLESYHFPVHKNKEFIKKLIESRNGNIYEHQIHLKKWIDTVFNPTKSNIKGF